MSEGDELVLTSLQRQVDSELISYRANNSNPADKSAADIRSINDIKKETGPAITLWVMLLQPLSTWGRSAARLLATRVRSHKSTTKRRVCHEHGEISFWGGFAIRTFALDPHQESSLNTRVKMHPRFPPPHLAVSPDRTVPERYFVRYQFYSKQTENPCCLYKVTKWSHYYH